MHFDPFVGGSRPADMESLQLSLGSQSGEQETSSYSKTTRITRKLIVKMIPPVKHSSILLCSLQATGCPYLEGMEESVVRDVVFSAGEARIRIIQWLLGRWEPCHVQYGILSLAGSESLVRKTMELVYFANSITPN